MTPVVAINTVTAMKLIYSSAVYVNRTELLQEADLSPPSIR